MDRNVPTLLKENRKLSNSKEFVFPFSFYSSCCYSAYFYSFRESSKRACYMSYADVIRLVCERIFTNFVNHTLLLSKLCFTWNLHGERTLLTWISLKKRAETMVICLMRISKYGWQADCNKQPGMDQITYTNCNKRSRMRVNKILLSRDRPEQFPSFLEGSFQWYQTTMRWSRFSKACHFLRILANFVDSMLFHCFYDS